MATSGSLLSPPQARRLGRKIADIESQLATLQAGARAAQLARSTISSVPIRDGDGLLTGTLGVQASGSTGVQVITGPPTGRAGSPTVTGIMHGVDVYWDGTVDAGARANLSHAEVHVSDTGPDFTPGDGTFSGTLSEAGSIPVAPLPSGRTYWARLVIVTLDGQRSAPSAAGSAVTLQVAAEVVLQGTVGADQIVGNSITAGHIQAGAVTAAKLAATLVLGSTIIAGTPTAARVQLSGSGIEAFRGTGEKVLDFDLATGDMTIAGRYRTRDSGSRIEANPGGTAPDEMRFYQGSVYAYLNAELAQGGNAALVARAAATAYTRGAMGVYPAEAFLTLTDVTGVRKGGVSAVDHALDLFVDGSITMDAKDPYGQVNFTNGNLGTGMTLQYRRYPGTDEATLHSPARDVGLAWKSGGYVLVCDQYGAGKEIRASAFTLTSSASTKTELGPVELAAGSARAGLQQVQVQSWRYTHEATSPRAGRGGHRHRRPRRDETGLVVLDADQRVRFDDTVITPEPARAIAPHLFPVAEDLLAAVPELVTHDPTAPGGLVVNLADTLGFVWQVCREQDTEIDRHTAELAALREQVQQLRDRVDAA